MNDLLIRKLEQKITETLSEGKDVKKLAKILSDGDHSKSFVLGIAVGRIYNAFYYQTKRILQREPTDSEFQEFLEFLKSRKSDLEHLW